MNLLKEVVKRAQNIVSELDEPLRQIAFSKILDLLLNQAVRGVITEKAIETPTTKIDLSVLIKRVNPKTNPERIATLAYHMKVNERQEKFTRKDILSIWQAVGFKKPGNFNRDFRETIRKGWISPIEGEDAFYLTTLGQEYIEEKLRE